MERYPIQELIDRTEEKIKGITTPGRLIRQDFAAVLPKYHVSAYLFLGKVEVTMLCDADKVYRYEPTYAELVVALHKDLPYDGHSFKDHILPGARALIRLNEGHVDSTAFVLVQERVPNISFPLTFTDKDGEARLYAHFDANGSYLEPGSLSESLWLMGQSRIEDASSEEEAENETRVWF